MGARRERERIEPRRLPVRERAVLAPQGPHEDLEPSVLVEDHLGGALARQHREQKPDEHGLARTRRAADEGVSRVLAGAAVRIPRVGCVKREMKGRLRTRHEKGERLAPVIARGTPGRVVVKGHHCGEVARGDRRLAGAHREVPGQLRPEGRFQRQVLPRDRHAGVGELRARPGDVVVEGVGAPLDRLPSLGEPRTAGSGSVILRIVRQDLEREVMIPHDEVVAGQGIERVLKLLGL